MFISNILPMRRTAILVDDEHDGLNNLERLISFCENVEVIGITRKPEIAIEITISKKPDILFIAIEMPRLSGFNVLESIRSRGCYPTIIFTTSYNQYAIKAIKAQVFDYLLKPIIFDELKESLNRLDIINISKSTISIFYKEILSNREMDVLDLITEGKKSKEIAKDLFISKTTVNTHRRNILKKTNSKSTSELLIKILH